MHAVMTETAARVDPRKVLIVEDDAAARATLSDLLTEEGYTCVEAAQGHEAIARLSEPGAPPCAILLDLMMPSMNGWEFRKWQRAHPVFAEIPVIVLSAVRDGPGEAAQLGAAGFVAKPIDIEELLQLVERHCGQP